MVAEKSNQGRQMFNGEVSSNEPSSSISPKTPEQSASLPPRKFRAEHPIKINRGGKEEIWIVLDGDVEGKDLKLDDMITLGFPTGRSTKAEMRVDSIQVSRRQLMEGNIVI